MNVVAFLVSPRAAFAAAAERPPPLAKTAVVAMLLGLIPPLCAFFGADNFGWRLGAGAPIPVSAELAAAVSAAYYLFLLGGFVFAALLMRWMAPTYAARQDLESHAVLLAAAGAPLMLGGIAHLYPQLAVNLMLLIPAMMWSAAILYAGLPIVLQTSADRGMLMATSMLGVFFVAACALLTLAVFLWTLGIGPDIGFNWRFSISG